MENTTIKNTHRNYKIALWPIAVSSAPLVYLSLYDTRYVSIGDIEFLNNLGIWALIFPSILASLCLLTSSYVGLWLSRLFLLGNITFMKVLLLELNKNADYVLNLPFLQIKRVWTTEEIYDKVINILSIYNIKVNPRIIADMVNSSDGSIIKAKGLAIAYADKVLNPTFWEKIFNFTQSNLPSIVITAVVGLGVGSIYIGVKNWLFPSDSLASMVGDVAKNTAALGIQQKAFAEHQDAINQKIISTVQGNKEATMAMATEHGAILNKLAKGTTDSFNLHQQAGTMLHNLANDVNEMGQTVHAHTILLQHAVPPNQNFPL